MDATEKTKQKQSKTVPKLNLAFLRVWFNRSKQTAKLQFANLMATYSLMLVLLNARQNESSAEGDRNGSITLQQRKCRSATLPLLRHYRYNLTAVFQVLKLF